VLTPAAVEPFAISEQAPAKLVLAGRSQTDATILVVACSVGLGVVLSWNHPTMLSSLAILPLLLFRTILCFLPASIVITPGRLEIRYRRFFPGMRAEAYGPGDIKGFDGTAYTFRGHFAGVRVACSNGSSKRIFSGPRGSRMLAQEHSSLLSDEFSRIFGLRPD
jgi:hypothetical protein